MQPLNNKPNLVRALGAVDVNADTRQTLDLVLVQGEETVCGDGSGWLAAQPSGVLRELDKGEKPIFFDAHEASHVIGRGVDTIAFLSVALIARQVRLTKQVNGPQPAGRRPAGWVLR